MFSQYCFCRVLLIFLLLFFYRSLAQNSTNFFPHHVGDMWEYYFTDLVDDDTIQVFVIEDSVDQEGNHYVTQAARSINPIAPPSFFFWDTTEYIVDTLNQVWMGSLLIYKLNAQKGEQWVLWGDPGNYQIARVTEVKEDTVFGIPTISKSFEYYLAADSTDTTGLFPYGDIVADGFGIIYRWTSEVGAWLFLKGAIINNILYDDTTLVSIYPNLPHSIPEQFHIYQNYPNPFNPTTNIRYDLPTAGKVELSVYDPLGRRVKVLVDSRQPAGSYEIPFDASGLSSGVYLYRLEIDQQLALTKKMVLLK